MKSIVIAGRMTKDAELRRLANDGTLVLSWGVAVDDGYGQNKRALFFDCSLFGKRGEALEQHMLKGTSITVSGDLSTREHNGKTYLTVRVSDVTLQGGKPAQSRPVSASGVDERGGGYPGHPDDEPGGSYGQRELDDEIPF